MKSHEWQVTNLEISKKLKELNCKQESLWYWCKRNTHGDSNNYRQTIPRSGGLSEKI